MTLLETRQAELALVDRFRGAVIPAHPMALDGQGRLDVTSQRALTRYYLAAGATGLAVGVHTTQFELHLDQTLLRDVWQLAAETAQGVGDPLLVAGVAGDVDQAIAEAETARELGYEAVLLSSWGMSDRGDDATINRARAVGEVLPIIGFYLQESVGGRLLGADFWRRLFDLPSVVAVKTAPFDRYRTNTVVRTLLEHERWDQVAVLTGNDDAIVADLVTPYRHSGREIRATGGLLGQWAVGTRAAARLVAEATAAVAGGSVPNELLALGADLVEVNAAVFDALHDFAGCVPGVNEVLRQQGLVQTASVLGPDRLSPGQAGLIAKVRDSYPDLLDEDFVAENKDDWLS